MNCDIIGNVTERKKRAVFRKPFPACYEKHFSSTIYY
jgi:hypothetical protein